REGDAAWRMGFRARLPRRHQEDRRRGAPRARGGVAGSPPREPVGRGRRGQRRARRRERGRPRGARALRRGAAFEERIQGRAGGGVVEARDARALAGVSERANPVAVVIVGAGAGTRFGGPKAGATLRDGRRFLDAIVETAKSAGLDPVIAVLPPGVVAPEGARVVVNATPESEQIISARLGLAQLTGAPVTS